jgi:hypothetical protein
VAIEPEDFSLLKEARSLSPNGASCAILGNCNISVGIEQFKQEMRFDTVDTFDVNGNPTYRLNLNEVLDETFYGKYDWVIDSGTLYCCFDVCTVWQNIIYLLANAGCVVHTGNLSGFFGRGFYSLSPALFRDFYRANCFTIQSMASKTRQQRQWKKFNPDHTYLLNVDLGFQHQSGEYVPFIPNDAMISCVATRTKRAPFIKPVPQHFVDTKGK